uniref:uS2 n=1 Tax=Paranosema locustae TaxID=235221 RepID=UPI00187D6E01|nr:Chain SA0, uS2 [Paranosema locustae]
MQKEIEIPEDFVKAIILSNAHLGSTTATTNFKQYIYGRRKNDLIHVIDINEMWKKLIIAARLFVSIEDPSSIIVASNKKFGKRAVLRFCSETGATPLIGRFIPGGFTNQVINDVKESRLVVVSDTYADKQTVMEASYVNTPCIAFCNSDNSLSRVDVVIPMNNRSPLSIGCGFYLFAKVIKYIKGEESFDVDVRSEIELYFYRDPVELDMIIQEQKEKNETSFQVKDAAPEVPAEAEQWADA